eukprot:1145816-Pelagomonas_calceolata.AAC.6
MGNLMVPAGVNSNSLSFRPSDAAAEQLHQMECGGEEDILCRRAAADWLSRWQWFICHVPHQCRHKACSGAQKDHADGQSACAQQAAHEVAENF